MNDTTINWLNEREIQFDDNGDPYFDHNDQQWHLSEFMRSNNSPWHAMLGLSNSHAMVIKLSDCGDAVTPGYIG